jgi:long-chain acyl-CoA synthetase
VVVFERADADPDRARFFVDGPGGFTAITWRAHRDAVERIAAFLIDAGLRKGDRAAIFAPNRIEWLAAAFGIQAAGGVLVPIYPSSTADQARYVLEHSGARVLFVSGEDPTRRAREIEADLPALEETILLSSLDDAERRGRLALERDPGLVRRSLDGLSDQDRGLMLYTSGTTGRPKGVPLTHANVGVNAEDWISVVEPGLPRERVDLVWLPFSHIFGFGEVCLGNLLGFQSYLVGGDVAIDRLATVRPTIFMSVPSYWEKIAKRSPDRSAFLTATGGRLAVGLSGGAGLDRSVKELFHQNGVSILEGYGLTETSPTLTINRPRDFRFDSVGKPLPRVDLRLEDDGEILARGPSVFEGYFADEEATRAAFTPDGWFRTGDVGRFTEDGFLQIVDRKKDILVTAGGKNIAPRNIELLLESDPSIERAIVYGDGRRYLVAGIWPRVELDGARDRAAERVDAVNRTLASFETIKRFTFMDEPLSIENGLLTPTLKAKRKQIYERFRSSFEALYA